MAFTPTTFNQINTGDKFSCRIQGVAVTGIVHKTGSNIYLCQNKKDGKGGIADKHGHKFSWMVPYDVYASVEGRMGLQSVTHFSITKSNAPKALPKVAAPKKATKSPKKAVVTVDEEIQSTKKKLADLEAKKAKEKEKALPKEVMGFTVTKQITEKGATYRVGCGEVVVTKEEAAKFAVVATSIIRRTNPRNAYSRMREAIIAATKLGEIEGKLPPINPEEWFAKY